MPLIIGSKIENKILLLLTLKITNYLVLKLTKCVYVEGVLEIESRTICMVGKHSISESYPHPLTKSFRNLSSKTLK